MNQTELFDFLHDYDATLVAGFAETDPPEQEDMMLLYRIKDYPVIVTINTRRGSCNIFLPASKEDNTETTLKNAREFLGPQPQKAGASERQDLDVEELVTDLKHVGLPVIIFDENEA